MGKVKDETQTAAPTTEAPETSIPTQPGVEKPAEITAVPPEAGTPKGATIPTAKVSGEPVTERTIPYGRFKEVNDLLKQVQRELAQMKGQEAYRGYSEQDMGQIFAHPFVQQLLLEQAENQLRQGAEEILSRFPNIPKSIAKAIIRNPRGYVNPQTMDVPSALLDIEDYVAAIAEEFGEGGASEPKPFPIAGTNVSAVPEEETTPAEIAVLMKKPPEEWTDEELRLAEEWQKGKSK